MARYAVAVMGPDRPGIVASVSSILADLGCNLEDVSTSILSGHFSMMLVVAAPEELDLGAVRTALEALESGHLATAAWPVTGAGEVVDATHVLTAYGPDSTGIVRALSSELAARGVDICDMVCRLHSGSTPVYVVTMEVKLPPGEDAASLGERIGEVGHALGLDTAMSEIEQAEL